MKPSFAASLSRHAATAYGLAVIAMMSIELFIFYGCVGVFTSFTIVYASVESSLILAPYWWLRGRWRIAMLVPVWLISIYIAVNIWYQRFWGYPMPMTLVTQAGNINSVTINSLFGVLSFVDVIFILIPAAATSPWLIARTFRAISAQNMRNRFKVAATAWSCFLFALILQIFGMHLYYAERSIGEIDFRSLPAQSFHNFMNPPIYAVRTHNVITFAGFIRHFLSDFSECVTSTETIVLSREEREEINRYVYNRQQPGNDPATQQRNLVLIVVESLNSDALYLKDNRGNYITPTLDSLVNAQGSLSCLHVRPQVAYGNSADGQLMYNLGTRPTLSGVASCDYVPKIQSLPSLPCILPEQYRSAAVFAGDGVSWQEKDTHTHYGYDSVFVQNDYIEAYSVDASPDAAMFDFTLQKLKHFSQPFILTLITIQMHAPYKIKRMKHVDFSGMGLTDERQRYLTCTADFDRRLGRFLQGLREAGVADKTLLVIVSDHNAPGSTRPDGLPSDIVFIAANCGHSERIATPVHQVDVFPTVLDLMEVRSSWRGVGHSMIGPHRGESDPRQATISDSILRSDYFPLR